MSPSAIALSMIFGIVVIGSGIGFYAGARYKMDLEQWTVAGRGFGLLLVWLLRAVQPACCAGSLPPHRKALC